MRYQLTPVRIAITNKTRNYKLIEIFREKKNPHTLGYSWWSLYTPVKLRKWRLRR